MRVGTFVIATFMTVISVVLASTAVLEHLNTFLLEEGEIPVTLDRTPPPSSLSKWIIYLTYLRGSDKNACQVYMADSTVPNAGMGLYSTVDLPKRSVVSHPELVIPITAPTLSEAWSDYLWQPDIPDIDVDESMGHAAFCPGLGSVINSNVKDLVNTYAIGKAQYNTMNIHRVRDEGAGGFTPFHKASTMTRRSVPAGSELFSYYGAFPEHTLVPSKQEFDEADQLMIQVNRQMQQDVTLTEADKEVIWNDAIQELPESFHLTTGTSRLMQYRWTDLWNDASIRRSNSWSRAVTQKQHIRSTDWIQENGFCLDLIKEGPSTLFQAGRGAFATRFIPKGTRIALAPLLHYMDPDIKSNGWSHGDLAEEMVRNYSFGHQDSSVLLTPHGAGVGLINHSRQAQNVKLQWPKQRLSCHDPDLLDLPLRTLRDMKQSTAGLKLSLEYVATTNVYPGEELFLNYGSAWENAWNAHVSKFWKPEHDWYLHPTQMRRDEPIRTVQELEYDPYPPNLLLLCEASFVTNEAGKNVYVSFGSQRKSAAEWIPCQVTTRHDNYVYTVEIFTNDKSDAEDVNTIVENVPHHAIMFDTYLLKSDWNLPTAFRHEMAFPDNLLPDQWRTAKVV